MFFLGILLLIRGFKGSLGKAVATSFDIPFGIISIVVALIVIINVTRRMLKFEAKRTKIRPTIK